MTDGKENKKAARLIMRADGVGRVMLNTPIFKGMTVGDAAGKEPKSKQIHLASLESGRSVPTLLRVYYTPLSMITETRKANSATDRQRRTNEGALPSGVQSA